MPTITRQEPNQQTSDNGSSQLSRQITRSSVLALGFSALVCVVGLLAFIAVDADLREGLSWRDLAARQAIASQRVGALAERLVTLPASEARREARDELIEAGASLLAALPQESPGNPGQVRVLDIADPGVAAPDASEPDGGAPDEIRALYFSAPRNIDRTIRTYVSLAERVARHIDSNRDAAGQAYAELRELGAADLPRALDFAETHLRRRVAESAEKAARVQIFFAAALLLGLIGQGAFLFRPLARSVARRTTDLLDEKAKVEHASLHDMLTNLPNRRQCADELEKAISAARRNGRRVAILHIDLDRFKAINDTFGHPVGDAVLVAAARRFERSVRRGDTVARLGGDEFVIIAPIETEPTEAARIATRILKKMARPIQCGANTVTTAASIGISIFPDDETDPEQLLFNADIALYRAKEEGRGRVSFFSPDMRREFEEREIVENDLRRAIANDEFEVHFQPQVRDDIDGVVGMEALVRWRHPTKGMVPAEQFMQIARSSGLIIPIGKWVIDKALSIAKTWNEAGLDYGVVSINVAAQQIREERFVDYLEDRMKCYGIDASQISIEVVEALLTDRRNESVARMVDRLQTLGITLDLDDFGTGYAALNHLKRYKINRLKIDRSFVGAIGTEAQNLNLIKTLMDVARNFEIDVLAEGVETDEQRQFLNALGCMQIQGYAVARPMNSKDAGTWLANRTADSEDRRSIA